MQHTRNRTTKCTAAQALCSVTQRCHASAIGGERVLLQWVAATPAPTRLRGGGAAHPQLLHLGLKREPHLRA